MQLSQPVREENHPLLQLLILGLSAFIGLLIFIVIGFVICIAIYGLDLIKNTAWITGDDLRYIGALKILVTAQQIGLFLVPAIVLAIFEGKKPQNFYGFKTPKLEILGIVLLLMFFSMPLMSWINEQNMNMHLPSFLSDLEKWMRKMEDDGLVTTKAILAGTSVGALVINLLVIAVTPAICEELIFRGYLMQGFYNLARNKWFPLVMTSVIFGTMHIFNPEVQKMGYLILVYYIGTGLFLGIITLMDEGTELALGFHAANNMVAALLITSDFTVFQTHSVFKDLSEPSLDYEAFLPVFVIYPLLIFLFSKIYKWTNWKEKLFGTLKD